MLRARVIPTLLLRNESLVKTKNFKDFVYVGDPSNTVRIFNELEVDELIFLDINASKTKQFPNVEVLKDISNECFMPLAYGGGIKTIEQAKDILSLGFEKISVNTTALRDPDFVSRLADKFGSQAVIVSIDVKRTILGDYKVFSHVKNTTLNLQADEWAKFLESKGAGEILLTSVDNEGSWGGLDISLTNLITSSVNIPVISCGGAGNIDHIYKGIKQGGASAIGVGSMVVFQKKDMGVLVNFPTIDFDKIII